MGAALQSSRTGDLLNGAYELHEVVDAGVEYDTYRATDVKRGRQVEVKLLKAELALQAGVVDRFLSGPRSLTGLRHPNVSQIVGIESDDTGVPFIVQESVQGDSFATMVASFPQGMPLGVAINVMSPVIDAVAAAHELGLVHGRLTRDQVMLVRAGGTTVPKVTRFGQAPDGVDASSDVRSLGALLYEALSGQPPGRPNKPHPPLDELAPHLPEELLALVERCLSRDPSERPQDATLLREALDAVAARLRGGERKPAAVAPAPRATPAPPVAAAARATPAAPAPPRKPSPPPRVAHGDDETQPVDVDAAAALAQLTQPKPQPSKQPERKPLAPEPSANTERKPAPAPAAFSANIGIDATVAQPAPSFAHAATAVMEAGEDVFAFDLSSQPPLADDDDAGELDDDDDEPELSFEPAKPSIPPATRSERPKKPKRKAKDDGDASALAAAFAPIEGADRIEQGEHEQVAMVRTFRESFEQAQQAAAQSRRRAKGKAESSDAPPAKRDAEPSAPGGPLLSRKQLREGSRPTGKLTAEQFLQIQHTAGGADRKHEGVALELLFFLFVLLLPFATPLLCDLDSAHVQQVLHGKQKLAAGVFGVLTVIALVRTWALQISAKPTLLRPVNTMLKVVTVTVCILALGFFLPAGAMGSFGRFARIVLPWASSGFYGFLALYGLARALREAGQSPVRGIGMTLLYLGAFFGSYQILTTTVLTQARRQAMAKHAGGHELSTKEKLTELLAGGQREGQADAGVAELGEVPEELTKEKAMVQRKEVGASEADDMAAVNELTEAKKRKSQGFEKMRKKMGELTR